MKPVWMPIGMAIGAKTRNSAVNQPISSVESIVITDLAQSPHADEQKDRETSCQEAIQRISERITGPWPNISHPAEIQRKPQGQRNHNVLPHPTVREAPKALIYESREKDVNREFQKKQPMEGAGTNSVNQIGDNQEEQNEKNRRFTTFFDSLFKIVLTLNISQQEKEGQIEIEADRCRDEAQIQ
jgi:hypothetical protein